MTRDETPVPAAPTPMTAAQIAATWGDSATRTYPDEDVAPMLAVVQSGGRWQASSGSAVEVLRAILLPDSLPVTITEHDCGWTFREGLGYLANDPECADCRDLATAKWKEAWNR